MANRLVYRRKKENTRTPPCAFGYPLFMERVQLQFEWDNIKMFFSFQMHAF